MILIIVYSVLVILFVFLSFVFSSSDMALGSLSKYRLEVAMKKDPKNKRLLAVEKLNSNYPRTISTILLLNDTVNAGMDSVATLLGVSLCMEILGPNSSQTELWGLVASLIVLILKITFGEIIAKSFGKIWNLKISALFAIPLRILTFITLPITYLVSSFDEVITRPLFKHVSDIAINEDDLHEMVESIEEQGTVDEEKATLLHETIRFTHTEAYEIMTPRVDIFAIDKEDDLKEICLNPEVYHYSRVPVFEGTIDNIVGFIKTKNLMLSYLKGKELRFEDILEEPLRFPRSTEINDILKTFRREKKHFAIVMDEYGGVEGLITMEDILEEIVGEIWDEKDDPEIPYLKRKDGSYIIDGSLTLEDFCNLLDLDFDETDTEYVTIGGFIIELLDDHFAKVGNSISYKGYLLKVLAVDKNGAVSKILVTKENK